MHLTLETYIRTKPYNVLVLRRLRLLTMIPRRDGRMFSELSHVADKFV